MTTYQIQCLLGYLGYDPGAIDGIDGPKTQAALSKFRSDYGMGAEGLVKAGARINWNGVLKRAAADLWDTAENNPDNAPGLWEDIAYKNGFRIIPEVITSGLAFALDEKGWWNGKLYRSTISANIHTPEQYPAGWELQE